MKDYLEELGIEGFTSRIKRLSDLLLYSTRDLYKTMNIDIEPNWNLVFRLLEEHTQMTITDIAARLQLTHPAVIKITNKMKQQGYLGTQADIKDKRKTLLLLSPKAHEELPKIISLWEAQNQIISTLLSDSPEILNDLTKIENKLIETDYKQRVLNEINSCKP